MECPGPGGRKAPRARLAPRFRPRSSANPNVATRSCNLPKVVDVRLRCTGPARTHIGMQDRITSVFAPGRDLFPYGTARGLLFRRIESDSRAIGREQCA